MPYMGREEWAEEKRVGEREFSWNSIGGGQREDSEHAFLEVRLGYGVYKRSF